MLPLLEFAADGSEHTLREARDVLAQRFELTDEELAQLLPSGRAHLFYNRVAWAKTYLAKAGLLEATRRGHFVMTDRGREVLASRPDELSGKYLERFPEFVEFRTRGKRDTLPSGTSSQDRAEEPTPEEQLQTAYEGIRADLQSDLLEYVLACSPAFFERLVLDLLTKMGYGGSRRDAARAIGRSGDEGIDGVINEDRLGLDVIYLQAKRWEGTVGRPEVQKFVGALHGKRAKKGVFVTTGRFSKDALEYVEHIEPRVILIDGPRLGELMVDFDLGVSTVETYEIKIPDTDYFNED